mmetsp:Transcript_20976/g.44900  ORF Transcript_20976/g.44900 Transcript_20976/m.44900 type:complete len:318 (+) Transcript_20976:99-1052(+)|eukprot:CAMPEP_0172527672 /NCGR_PEP_ID=MMETSP1067-20121228/2306_1 /TAXON_ID=265564 ORGANISM="Thalassiosira punctigera, Strain Tpunct2005C2" /NCGR_SAMPLE_ID=MMETSP1067 /ASSEMBLY_ACC=CAM_ASM_000444 /LENGTH=317 /DNA_ID=CAMNT_0013311461 /DNA_START=74 /DNA_END=1027 /DNA_ORIENTATION=+
MTACNASVFLICLVAISSPPKRAFGFVMPSEDHHRKKPTSLFHRRHEQRHDDDYDRRAFLFAASAASAALPLLAPPSIDSGSAARAISPERASESYDAYAPTYDDLDGGALASSLGIDDARKRLLGAARGDVLEIGVGTGLNLDSYRFSSPDGVRSLTLVDVSEGMLSRARERAGRIREAGGGIGDDSVPVKFVRADATSELCSLFGEDAFDTVVDTFSLCVMGNEGARRCLSEMAGVVKRGEDGGRILLIENTRASNPLLGYYQDVTASAAADVGGKGCIYNQNVGDMIRRTKGLQITKEEAFAAGLFRSFTCQKI